MEIAGKTPTAGQSVSSAWKFPMGAGKDRNQEAIEGIHSEPGLSKGSFYDLSGENFDCWDPIVLIYLQMILLFHIQ